MTSNRHMPSTISRTTLMRQIAHSLVRQASEAEGLDAWLHRHGGSVVAPSRATRCYAWDLLGDTEEAFLMNVALVLEVDRCQSIATA